MTYFEIWHNWTPALLRGAVVTLELASFGLVASLIIGLPIAMLRICRFIPVQRLTRAYIDVVRGLPELLLLFLIYFGLAEVGLRLSAFVATAIWLAIVGSVSAAEVYRAGIMAVEAGQVEAARSLGLSSLAVYRLVVFPQAIMLVLPPLGNVVILIVKGTALAFSIGIVELMGQANIGAGATYQTLPLYLEAALIYVVLIYPLSRAVVYFERKAARRK